MTGIGRSAWKLLREGADGPAQSSSTAPVWLGVFGAGFAAIVALLAMTIATPPFDGDLTRVGMLSESAFGRRAPQPAVDAALLRSSRLAEADVLVVGDSSAEGGVWQSELVRSGLRVKTVDWHQFGRVCRDLDGWLAAQGFHGHTVIFQSVERELDTRVTRSAGCERTEWRLWRDTALAWPPPPTVPPAAGWNFREKVTTGVLTAWNTRRARRATQEFVVDSGSSHDRTRVVPLAEGCRWFSHALCERGLFLEKDVRRPPPGDETLARMQALSAAAPGAPRRVWLVVPNKTLVYLGDRRAFWAALPARGLGPDLHTPLVEARDRELDVYRPNDSHPSTLGMLLIGRAARDAVRTGAPR